jgi:hypothetical protein
MWIATVSLLHAQVASVFLAPRVAFPAPVVDGNSPGFWDQGVFTVYTSDGGNIMAMRGAGAHDLAMDDPPVIVPWEHAPMWIESVWRDDDGVVYAWYHHEPPGLCGGELTAPQIGALISTDGGRTFEDLGIVLASGDPLKCDAANLFFAGGHGDFSVVLDRERAWFYLLFTNYGGPVEKQGVSIARMAFEDRAHPAGKVYKFHRGEWNEPGIGGDVTPIFRTFVAWEHPDANSFWGPAVHWNTALERYVMLLNHACCEPGWPQEGIYIAFTPDLSDPSRWTEPAKILDSSLIGFAPGWYPQVFGVGAGETDTQAGQYPRLFIKGVSSWVLFLQEKFPDEPSTQGAGGEPPEARGSPPE